MVNLDPAAEQFGYPVLAGKSSVGFTKHLIVGTSCKQRRWGRQQQRRCHFKTQVHISCDIKEVFQVVLSMKLGVSVQGFYLQAWTD
mgnify:CR=1 FL=1